ncbi:ABC-2 type transporter [Suillus subluteus]|nr:ABC-2 type transporter [Suillus subluteus]
MVELTKCNFLAYWHNPTYLIAKITLNIAGGLLIGFTFFSSKDTLQGMQNKLFMHFFHAGSTILSVPITQQLQSIYINIHSIYEIHECPSRMYSCTALVTLQLLVEISWNIFCSSLFFLCWYWAVGFPTNRAGYTYLMYGIVFPLYYTSIAKVVRAMAPSTVITSLYFSMVFSFVIIL